MVSDSQKKVKKTTEEKRIIQAKYNMQYQKYSPKYKEYKRNRASELRVNRMYKLLIEYLSNKNKSKSHKIEFHKITTCKDFKYLFIKKFGKDDYNEYLCGKFY